MTTNTSNQPLTHWAQLLVIYLLPGVLQGLAFYTVALGSEGSLLNWRAFVLWFLVIAPVCVFLITVPKDRWRSVCVSVFLGLVLSTLFFFDAKDAFGANPENSNSGSTVALAIACSLVVVFSVLPFYRTRWQRNLPYSHYASLFEFAWNQTVCVLIGLAFTGLVAALVGLTAALFQAVGVSLESWLFDSPLTGAWVGGAFAIAIGVTRQSDTVVLGARVLLLALLRILLPVMLPVCILFVGLVAVVGVEQLDTGLSVAFIVVAAAIIAITLISARIGDANEQLSGFHKLLTRGMAAVVLPLSLLAVHALWFRVQQHGWTGDRMVAAVIVLMTALYGTGYLLAVFRNPLVWIPVVNRWMAGLCALVALLFMTPLLDPDRIGVRDQIARFNDGRTSAEQLDLAYLKFQSGRVGREALEALSSRPESREPPLDARLEQLAEARYEYDIESANMSPEQRLPLADAVRDGTFRLLEEQASGWVRLTELDQMTDAQLGELMGAGYFEIDLYCLERAQDCAYLISSTEADMLAIRLDDTNLIFFSDTLSSAQYPPAFPPPAPPAPPAPSAPSAPSAPPPNVDQTDDSDTGMVPGTGFSKADIDDWFASLDQGRVTTELVEVPSIVIGPFRVLRRGTVLLQ